MTPPREGIAFSGSCIGNMGDGSMFFALFALLIFLERLRRNTIKATMSRNIKMLIEAMAAMTAFERPLFEVLAAPEALYTH